MVIDKIIVSYDTFKMLYAAYNEYAQKKQTIVFENNIYEIMQTLSVSIQLSKLSSFDLLVLYEMGVEVYPISIAFGKLPNPNELEGSLKDARRVFPHALAIKSHIRKESKKDPYLADGIVPLACASHDTAAQFSGQRLYQLTSITGNLLMDDIFRDKNGFLSECPSEEYLENYFGGKFTSAFFTTILNLLKNIDVRKEYYMENNYYHFADKKHFNSVVLCNAMTQIHGGINFINIDPSVFTSTLQKVKDSIAKDPSYDQYQTTFTFVCYTSIENFLLLRLSGYGEILHHEDFKIVYGKNHLYLPSDISDTTRDEAKEFLQEIQTFRDQIDQKSMPDLSKLQFMYHGNPICYLYRITMKDLLSVQDFARKNTFNDSFNELLSVMYNYMQVVVNNLSSDK